MSGEAPRRRRLRIRRKRKTLSVAADVVDVATNEVVAELGCCLVEAVAGAVAIGAAVSVPTYYLLH